MIFLCLYAIISKNRVILKIIMNLGGIQLGNLKKILSREYVKWKYSKETTPQLVKIGMKIGFGMMCVVASVIVLFK